jgi:aromatase
MALTHSEHAIDIAAPAATVAAVVGAVSSWPTFFPPTVHARRESGDDREETIRIWATANGELRTWTSLRTLSADGRRVDFDQQEPRHPVAAMGGSWRITSDGDGCRVVLLHHYAAVDDDPDVLEKMNRAVDTNSTAELAALKSSAERAAADLVYSFADTEVIEGPLDEAYAFVNDCARWPERLPHVARLHVDEPVTGLQMMEMDTRSADGSVHTTVSGRVCFDGERIVYKQTTPPRGLAGHRGEWTFEQRDGGRVLVTSRHTVVLDPDAFASLPNPPADLDEARALVRHALGSNSRTTLAHAKAHVEGAAATTTA